MQFNDELAGSWPKHQSGHSLINSLWITMLNKITPVTHKMRLVHESPPCMCNHMISTQPIIWMLIIVSSESLYSPPVLREVLPSVLWLGSLILWQQIMNIFINEHITPSLESCIAMEKNKELGKCITIWFKIKAFCILGKDYACYLNLCHSEVSVLVW